MADVDFQGALRVGEAPFAGQVFFHAADLLFGRQFAGAVAARRRPQMIREPPVVRRA